MTTIHNRTRKTGCTHGTPPYKGFALESCKRLLGQSLGLCSPREEREEVSFLPVALIGVTLQANRTRNVGPNTRNYSAHGP